MRPLVRTAAIACNVILMGVTAGIVLTEGMPSKAAYVVLTLLLLVVPLLTAVVFLRGGAATATPGLAHRAVVVCNVVSLAAAGWAIVSQYPYPEGNSVIPFAMLTVCTPLLSLMALPGGSR